MRNIVLFSAFLLAGLVLSQVLPAYVPADSYEGFVHAVRVLTTVALGFIMIRVGYEFDIDKSRLGMYAWDYVVAATSATFPWIFVAVYFVLVFADPVSSQAWKESLLASRFAAPTSAGLLFSMLAAGGLAATWMYRKIRVLAIFDDLDTVLLMIPLKIMLVGWKWQLGVVVAPMFLLLWAAWRYLHRLRIPISWPWVMGYSAVITLVAEVIYVSSKLIDEVVPIHIEVLLPAFAIGCMMVRRERSVGGSPVDVIESPVEKRVALIVSTVFMVLVGLSMPAIVGIAGPSAEVNVIDSKVVDAYIVADPGDSEAGLVPRPGRSPGLESSAMGFGWVALHVLVVTLLANLGKMFPLFCYRKEAGWKERLALAVGMFPRGEVGAGVLIISISYGIGGPMITVAMLSLALNLLLTGLFIVAVRRLLGGVDVDVDVRGRRAASV